MTITDLRTLSDIGPIALKDPSSVEYAWQLTEKLKRYYQSKEISLQRWQETVDEAKRNRIFERVPPENPYGSLDALLEAEIGVSEALSVERVKAQAVAKTLEGGQHYAANGELGQGRDTNSYYNIIAISTPNGTNGTSADYLTARIARDHPDILERMKAGKYASVRKAGIDAGIVKPRLSIPIDPKRAAKAIKKHFTSDQIAQLIAALGAE